MKKVFVFVFMASAVNLLYAQPGTTKPVTKSATKPVTKPGTPTPVLKNLTDSANYALGLSFANFCKQQGRNSINTTVVLKAIDDVFGSNKNDSASYALGLSFANFYKEQGIKTVNKTLIQKGMNDVLGNKKMLLDDAASNSVMNSYLTKIQQQKSQAAIDSGNAFLAKNKLKPGVKTTASGLQYEVITEGTGERPTSPTDSVTCHYRGVLLNASLPFDDSYSRGAPITFALNRVIAGWTEGLQLMSVGSKYKLYIPYTLGYGAFDYGPIPGGSMLTFDVELLAVKKAVTQPPAQQPQQPAGNN
jgi:FKBP-type peptidyl-prolyl cis-trans isomerase